MPRPTSTPDQKMTPCWIQWPISLASAQPSRANWAPSAASAPATRQTAQGVGRSPSLGLPRLISGGAPSRPSADVQRARHPRLPVAGQVAVDLVGAGLGDLDAELGLLACPDQAALAQDLPRGVGATMSWAVRPWLTRSKVTVPA